MATKKEIQELENKLDIANREIDELNNRIASLKEEVLREIAITLPSVEAKKLFVSFAPLAQTREHMILLVRALSRIE